MDLLAFWGWRVGAALVQRVPLTLAYAAAGLLADLTYLGWRSRRQIAKHNLAGLLRRSPDDREVSRVARRSFREFAKTIVEIMRFPRVPPTDFKAMVEIEGAEHFERAFAHGRGVIFVSAHFGSFELGGLLMAQKLAPITVLADDLDVRRIFEHLVENRATRGVNLITREGAARAALRALKNNELVGMMVDLGPRAEAFDTVTVRFCGRDTTFPAVAAQLARVSGAPIVVGCVVRRDRRPFLGIAHEPIFVERTRRAVEDVEETMQRIVSDLERFLTQWPEQWYIFRPMWPLEQRETVVR